MAKQITWRWLLGVCCWLVVLLGGRSASAAAPMCDERGASAVAPTPVLPIRDLRLDVTPALPCPDRQPVLANGAATHHQGVTPVDAGTREAWISQPAQRLPVSSADLMRPARACTTPAASPYVLDVFRPPRG